MDDTKPKGKPDFTKYKKVYDEAILRFAAAEEAENENREAAKDDIQWRLGNQWAEKTKKARKQRPTLTVNRLDEFVRRTVNELRKNRPAIKVGAADSAASDQVASITGGLARKLFRIG
jgi:site-specific DNA-cytosine methylase